MKLKNLIRLSLICGLLSLFAGSAKAQSHSASLTWTLSTDDTTVNCTGAGFTCSQNVYRATGACSQTAVFVLLSSQTATATSATDATVTPGSWCYAITFVENGSESVKATVAGSLQPASPSNVAVSIK